MQVVKALNDALQVTHAIAVTVLERPGIYLVNNAGLPPENVVLAHVFNSCPFPNKKYLPRQGFYRNYVRR
jgi:hypothetical protein